jgi:hypothetical protein
VRFFEKNSENAFFPPNNVWIEKLMVPSESAFNKWSCFSCRLQMTFKESHILGAPHSNNISQLGTGLSKVLWVAGYRLWSRRVHMWRAHNGVAVAGESEGVPPLYENIFLIWIVFESRYIPVSNLLTYYLKISWDLKKHIPANFVSFYLNEG